MDEEAKFHPTRPQRAFYLVLGVIFILIAIADMELTKFLGSAQLAVGCLLVAMSFVMQRMGVVVNRDGLRVVGLRTQLVSWSEIASIDVVPFAGKQNVVVVLKSGRRKSLRAPFTGFLQRDPEFDNKVEVIRRSLSMHVGATP